MTQRIDSRDVVSLLESKYGYKATLVNEGHTAWAAIKDGGPELVVVDWKLTRVSGAALLNRIKQDSRYADRPVMVVSELTQKENFTLLNDYPFIGLADGQFSLKAFEIKLDVLLEEMKKCLSDGQTLAKIAANFTTNEQKARGELNEFLKSRPTPAHCLYVMAKKLRKWDLPSVSEALLKDGLKLSPQHAASALELASVLQLTGKTGEAKTLLNQHKFSKKNTERMLVLGSVFLQDMQAAEAKAAFAGALAIDGDLELAKAGALVAGNLHSALDKTPQDQYPESFVQAMDVVAEAKGKAGQESAVADNYKAALQFVSDAVSQAQLMCAIGLSFEKQQKKPEALDWMTRAAKAGGSQFPKANEELTRMKSGKPAATAAPAPAAAPAASSGKKAS
jgi:CheY-like chemotaxis protein